MPQLIGQIPDTRRVKTGLATLDRAFNKEKLNLGVPVGIGMEFFGPTHTGKSTFAYSLSSILSRIENRGWVLCDLEGFDKSFLLDIAEFQGMGDDLPIQVCDGTTVKNTNLATASDEALIDELAHYLSNNYATGVLDSIGAVSPIAEAEGDLGEANMGRRGRVMAQFTRKMTRIFRRDDAPTVIALNHYYPKLGQQAWTTPGGEVKNYLFSVRVRLQSLSTDRMDNGSYLLRGFVEKNRWGGGRDGNEFEVYVQSGFGIHAGLTAVRDSVTLGVATKPKKIELNGKSYWWKELCDGWNEPELFQPFIDALEKFNEETK